MAEWCPFLTRRDGPPGKFGGYAAGSSGPKRGEVKHSAEGLWPGLYSQLDGAAPVSWQFTIGFDRSEQHYPLTANCWHAGDSDNDGNVRANIDLIGIEHLGVAGQPLTYYQVDMTARVTRWASEQFGLTTFGRFPTQAGVWTLAEHNQVGNLPTSCPSGRIPWGEILRQLEGEDELAGIARRNGNIIEFTNQAGFVVLRLGNEDGSEGSRIQVPEGDPGNGGRWRTYKKSGAKMPDGSDIIVLE